MFQDVLLFFRLQRKTVKKSTMEEWVSLADVYFPEGFPNELVREKESQTKHFTFVEH